MSGHCIPLVDREVCFWPIHLERSTSALARCKAVLAPDEQKKAGRFRFEHLQHSFILARGCLRFLLSRYLQVSPNCIQFIYGPQGKPSLVPPARITFNMSRSGRLAVFAFTTKCEIGVDVELIRAISDMPLIASQFFCPEEAAELLSLPYYQRAHAFFLCWTRKEAYVKAVGRGLSIPLDEFRVTLRPDEPARLVHLKRDIDAAKIWTLHSLIPTSQHAAAVAYKDEPRPVRTLPALDVGRLLESF
ncbi:MAG TPA: 4'-phosphopantetheinyl transferase superfamily protein [Terriglobales bacterium]|jgi:4'-phosphopantetheinyl transferase|nr:4'-phosphopantetheinyl transferase superfamily protein [Terriglobales bacterium]